MRYISLFSGIGGFDLGFNDAEMECVAMVDLYDPESIPEMVVRHQAELEEAAMIENPENRNKAIKKIKSDWTKLKSTGRGLLDFANRQFPDVLKINGVQNVTNEIIKSAGAVDLVCGGFPCQDVSVAGKRKGLAGERSGLWFEFRRIVNELKPEWVVIENVPGLLSSNGGRDMGTVVGGLAECGYWWAYRVLDAQFYGVPQRRRRVFIVASLTAGRPQQVLFEPESSPWDTPPSREAGPGFTAAITERTRNAGRTLETQDNLAYALTNPGSSERPQSRVVAFSPQAGGNTGLNINDDLSGTLQENQKMAIIFQQNSRDEVRLMNGDGLIAGALGAQPGMKQQNYIANTFNGYSGGADDNDAQGNHLVIANTLSTEEGLRGPRGDGNDNLVSTWTIRGGKGKGGKGHLESKDKTMALSGQPQYLGVRRLTPLECERLQGFPDNWTSGQSDSARYRQLGNAVAVPVARWLGERIVSLSGEVK